MTSDLVDRINKIQLQSAKKGEKIRPISSKNALKSHDAVQLPLWGDPLCGLPNSVLRSALFGVIMRGRRRYMDKELLESWLGVSIRYTGMKLDQADLDVWMMAVHMARKKPLGTYIDFTAYRFLKDLSRATGKKNRDWLNNVFTRLNACAVTITINETTYSGSLIYEYFYDEQTKRYMMAVNPRLAVLFNDGYSLIEWQSRKELKSDLAKWLLGYVRSHYAPKHQPHRIGLERLRSLCGSEIKDIQDFRKLVRKGMQEIARINEVTHWDFTKNGALEFIRVNQ